MAGSIILAQFVMIGVAYTVGIYVNDYSRKSIFLIAFLILPIRAFFYTLTDNAAFLLAIQLLDGIGAGIFGVIAIVIISDLAQGTGRFNFFQGLVALCTGLGASLSNLVAGSIVKQWGYNAGFLFLCFLAIVGTGVFFGFLCQKQIIKKLQRINRFYRKCIIVTENYKNFSVILVSSL